MPGLRERRRRAAMSGGSQVHAAKPTVQTMRVSGSGGTANVLFLD